VEGGDLIASAVTNEVDSVYRDSFSDLESSFAHEPLLGLLNFSAELLGAEFDVFAHILDHMANRPAMVAEAIVEKAVDMVVLPWNSQGSFESELRTVESTVSPAVTILYFNSSRQLRMPSLLPNLWPSRQSQESASLPKCRILALLLHGESTDERLLGIILPLIKAAREDVDITLGILNSVHSSRPSITNPLRAAQRNAPPEQQFAIIKAESVQALEEMCKGSVSMDGDGWDLAVYGAPAAPSAECCTAEEEGFRRSNSTSRRRASSLRQSLLPTFSASRCDDATATIRGTLLDWRHSFLRSASLVEVHCGNHFPVAADLATIPDAAGISRESGPL